KQYHKQTCDMHGSWCEIKRHFTPQYLSSITSKLVICMRAGVKKNFSTINFRNNQLAGKLVDAGKRLTWMLETVRAAVDYLII
ncbi:hypothetical protein, partial [Anaerocolumna jejuensis]|uniref:hypothetical protein n=1 Tax=Anaerocolumna jejuensis TaxID=259063 RepID=UPI003F7C356F